MGFPIMTASAMTGEGVREAFTRLLEDVHAGGGAGEAQVEGTVQLGKKKEGGVSTCGC